MTNRWTCTQRPSGWNVADTYGTVLFFPREEDAMVLCDILNKNFVDSKLHAAEFEQLVDLYVVTMTRKHVRA